MSFSSDVKEELARQYSKSRHCQLAELAGMLELEGSLNAESGAVTLATDNMLLYEKYEILLQKAFGITASTEMDGRQAAKILAALRWDGENFMGIPLNERRADGLLVQQTCCKRAFIRGAFMAAGSISNPNKSYHFEIVCRTMDQALQLQELMAGFEAEAKIVERKERYVIYLKEGSQIVDMLNVMEAYVSLMNLENVRILKEMRNSVNRKVNCETANIHKTVNAAVKQMEDIKRIQSTIGFEQLPNTLAEMAQVRLEHPEATLKELGTYLDPPVGKSGVNHRLRKLAEIAEKL
ncbi:MAG: DNA-binding protein WhiA [Lachnospiraceae bacterium]|nr:DNA-binding protein WhiA [Lachnospiraceae bacterium]